MTYETLALPEEKEQEIDSGLQLDRFVAAIKRRVWLVLGVTALTTTATVFDAVIEPSVYKSGFELLTPSVTVESEITSTLDPGTSSDLSEIVGLGENEKKIKILTSPRVMEPIVDELKKIYPNITYTEIIQRLEISSNTAGNVLTVQYKDTEPRRVLNVLNEISDAYLRYSLEGRQDEIYRGIDFVDEQLPQVRKRVETLESELELLRQNSSLIDPLVRGDQLSQQMTKFSAEQLELAVLIEQTEQLYLELERELSASGEFASASVLQNSPRYQKLLDQILEIESQLADDLTLYLEDSPEIQVIEERRSNLRPLLDKEGLRVQTQLLGYLGELRDRDKALSEAVNTLQQRIKSVSTVARQYSSIRRELDIATTNLNQLLNKRETLRIDAAQSQTPWDILTPPGEPQAAAASTYQSLLIGGLLGLLLGVGAALLVDRIIGKIYTVRELRHATQLPLLGAIPRSQLLYNASDESYIAPLSNKSNLGESLFNEVYGDDRYSQTDLPFLESFRRLITNIRSSNPDIPIRTLTIGSAIPNEGKSSISFYLAYANASMGRRTLIVDTDLRRPSLQKICNVPQSFGISNYAAGECELEDIIFQLPSDENLFLIPAGTVTPNPTKILSSSRAESLFSRLKKDFDMVIFDTPPLLEFTDALIVARKTQGLLLTCRLGELKHQQLQAALDELQIAKVPTIGTVANGIRQDREAFYANYSSYRSSKSQNKQSLLPQLSATKF